MESIIFRKLVAVFLSICTVSGCASKQVAASNTGTNSSLESMTGTLDWDIKLEFGIGILNFMGSCPVLLITQNRFSRSKNRFN